MASTTVSGTITLFAYSAPQITSYKATRYVMDDDTAVVKPTGENVMVSVAASVASVNGANAYTAKIAYNVDGSTDVATTPAFASGADGGEISVTNSTSALTATLAASDRWKLELIVEDQFTTVTATVYVEKSKAYFAVTPEGVCAGGFVSIGTLASPTFESVYPAHFLGGMFNSNGLQIDSDSGWITLPLEANVTAHDANFAIIPQYRKIGNHVYIKGHVNTAVPSGGRLIAQLPEGFRPSGGTHYDIGECAGQRVSRIYTDVGGNLRCEWVYTLGGTAYTSALWIQIDMDYLVD